MASAGRILIMPKGNYDARVTYEMLDCVFYGDTSWIAKKTVSGIVPSESNNEHWHKLCSPADLSNYLSLDGGNMIGHISFDGKGLIYATEYATVFSAKKDNINYRDIRVGNPIMATQPNDMIKIIDCVNGEEKDYKIFGEHNLALVNQYIDARISEYMKNNG
jgi:hypothetical protein